VLQPFSLPKTCCVKKQKKIGAIISAERGELLSLICAINAIVISILPMVVFPRFIYKVHITQDGLTGVEMLQLISSSRTNEEMFTSFCSILYKNITN